MEMTKAPRTQGYTVRDTSTLAPSIKAAQTEAQMFDTLTSSMMSIHDKAMDGVVRSMRKSGQEQALADNAEGNLDLNSGTFTQYGDAYDKQAKLILHSEYEIALDNFDKEAQAQFPESPKNYAKAMEGMYLAWSQDLSDEDKLIMSQQSRATTDLGFRNVTENAARIHDEAFASSITTTLQHLRRDTLKFADLGDKDGMDQSLQHYNEVVDNALESRIITAPKAQALKKAQYDETVHETIISGFDRLLEVDTASAINYAYKFNASQPEVMFPNDNRQYDVHQRDVMYSEMVAKINAATKTDKSRNSRSLKYNNNQVKDAVTVMQSGAIPYNLSETLAFTPEEVDPTLYEQLRFEQAILPERMMFNELPAVGQYQHIERLEAKTRAGVGTDAASVKMLDAFKAQYAETVKMMASDPAAVRKRGLTGDLSSWDGDINTIDTYLLDSQGSVTEFAESNGGLPNYFSDAEATVLSGTFRNMDTDSKLAFIQSVQGALGDDARHVFDQIGQKGYGISVLAHTTSLDSTGVTSRGVIDGYKMMLADKSLLPKEAPDYYNQLEKSGLSEYSVQQRDAIKSAVLSHAVYHNQGGIASNIDDDMIQQSYNAVVGETVTGGMFSSANPITAPWQGATYDDFEFAIENLTVDDMPRLRTDSERERLLDIMQEGDDNIAYKSVGVGDYHVYIDGKPINEWAEVPDTGMYQLTPYILKVRK